MLAADTQYIISMILSVNIGSPFELTKVAEPLFLLIVEEVYDSLHCGFVVLSHVSCEFIPASGGVLFKEIIHHVLQHLLIGLCYLIKLPEFDHEYHFLIGKYFFEGLIVDESFVEAFLELVSILILVAFGFVGRRYYFFEII